MNDALEPLVAGVELGGTKAIAVLGRGNAIIDRFVTPTVDPATTLGAVRARLEIWAREHQPQALGIATFGPVRVDPKAADYGQILPTTKPGWSGADVLGTLASAIAGPSAIETDVTAAAFAEGQWGAAQGLSDHIYVTIGTGIGMGIIVNGSPVAGQMHPEAGHIRVRRLAGDDFAGACSFHHDCLEGLASGPAIAARAGTPAETLGDDSPHWLFVADAIAEAFATLIVTLAPQRIVVGGGVGVGKPFLLERVRMLTAEKIGGYLGFAGSEEIAALIVPAQLGGDAGPLGAIRIAQMVLAQD